MKYERWRPEVTLPAVTPGDQARREASQASSLTMLLVTCHVSRVTSFTVTSVELG